MLPEPRLEHRLSRAVRRRKGNIRERGGSLQV